MGPGTRASTAAWRDNLLTSSQAAEALAKAARRVAVLGIKPESRAEQPAHHVPKYLQEQGVAIVPVPTYYPDVTEILGVPVERDLGRLNGREIDILNVFRKPADVGGHVEDILRLKPKAVWLQLGIWAPEAEERFARAGIQVVADRCLLIDHQNAVGHAEPGFDVVAPKM